MAAGLRACRSLDYDRPLDLGHGINFSYRIARKMMDKGIFPDSIGSDVHGDFTSNHDFSILDYSLVGGLNKLIGLGMSLTDCIRALTVTPARILADPSIGHLGAGARANLTVMRQVEGDWTFVDCRGERLWLARLRVEVGRTADSEPGIGRERSVGGKR